MVAQRLPRSRLEPGLDLGAMGAQDRHRYAFGQGFLQRWAQGLVVRNQPELVDLVALLAEHLAQLALHVQLLFTSVIASPILHHGQQPLAFQRCRSHRLPGQIAQVQQGGNLDRRRDQLAIGLAAGLEHVEREVGRKHRRRTGRHHQQHAQATTGRALLSLQKARVWLAVHRHGEGVNCCLTACDGVG